MKEFSTWIFDENDVRTHNKKVERERLYYIGVLIIMIAVVLALLDLSYVGPIMVVGIIIYWAGNIVMWGKKPSIGHYRTILKLTPDAVYIGNDRYEIKSTLDLRIHIANYDGQRIGSRPSKYTRYSGNDNTIWYRTPSGMKELNFVLTSEHHKDQLEQFCKENGFIL